MWARYSRTHNAVVLTKSRRASGHRRRSRPERELGPPFLRGLQELNDATRKDCFPVLRIVETLYPLAGAILFSTLDLKRGYWQVEMHPNKEKTAISTGQGLWQFSHALWTCNAPAMFKRLTEAVLRGLTYESCLLYLDDLIMVGRKVQEHLFNLWKVLQ